MDIERFDRQILLFGREGQRNIAARRVAIVGLGGTGSHVAQQLAYLGVRDFGLIDADIATRSSLNRLVGATPDDVAAKRPKVEIAARLIGMLDPEARVVTVADSFLSDAAAAVLANADVIFGCVDRDGARLLLTEFACAYDKPYFDLATDTHGAGDQLHFGGRLVLRLDNSACPYCLDLLDPDAVQRDLSSPERRAEQDAMYGVKRDALGAGGPSVISLNGIIASLAVTEFLVFATGIVRPPKRLLRYDGLRGIVLESKDPPRTGCPYCTQTGRADAADWQRHLRAGLGRWVR